MKNARTRRATARQRRETIAASSAAARRPIRQIAPADTDTANNGGAQKRDRRTVTASSGSRFRDGLSEHVELIL